MSQPTVSNPAPPSSATPADDIGAFGARPRLVLCVVMERAATQSRWQAFQWRPIGVLPDDGARADGTVLVENEGLLQRLHIGFETALFPDEAEGYFLNISSPDPRVFVAWRVVEDDPDDVRPYMVTLSYNEAARWMDAQEKVEGVPMPDEIAEVLAQWVSANYRPPEKKQRIRPRSFESKEGRYKGGLS
ncbi:MAG: DUF3305 domain-containing protein [Burkholderiales bacterium]